MKEKIIPAQRKKVDRFIDLVWSHYREHGRHDMPWRRDTSPYAIVVSEIMLQQTQVPRVTVKFASWMKRFPDWQALATASTKDVLEEWSGLGYNRRALYLKRIAETITDAGAHPGTLPDTFEDLRTLPGIGPNTAGAILAYAFNKPQPFIETNIRSAYIHFFFPRARRKIPDAELMPLIETTLADKKVSANPREWHWALMDYGSHLKATKPNPSRKSAHHVRQNPFKGSNRELRSKILKAIMKSELKFAPITGPAATSLSAASLADYPSELIKKNLEALEREGFIKKRGRVYEIA